MVPYRESGHPGTYTTLASYSAMDMGSNTVEEEEEEVVTSCPFRSKVEWEWGECYKEYLTHINNKCIK